MKEIPVTKFSQRVQLVHPITCVHLSRVCSYEPSECTHIRVVHMNQHVFHFLTEPSCYCVHMKPRRVVYT